MKIRPVLLILVAVVALGQVPTQPPLTADSQVIVDLCRRNADYNRGFALLLPLASDYFNGKADAYDEAAQWLQDYLPRVAGGAPALPPTPPRVVVPPRKYDEP